MPSSQSRDDMGSEESPTKTAQPKNNRKFFAPRRASTFSAPAAAKPATKPSVKPSAKSAAKAPPPAAAGEASAPVTHSKPRRQEAAKPNSSSNAAVEPMEVDEEVEDFEEMRAADEPSAPTPAREPKSKSSKGKASKGGGAASSSSSSAKKTKGMDPKDKAIKAKNSKTKEASSVKDPLKPKKPCSAYQFWCKSARSEPEYADLSFGDANKALGAKWKELDGSEKEPFEAEAKEARRAYERLMMNYKPPAASSSGIHKKAKVQRDRITKAPKRSVSATPLCDSSEDEDEDDEAPSSVAARALVNSHKIPTPDSLPVLGEEGLTDEDFEPRELQAMRVDKYANGSEVAWVPQGFAAFLEAHEEQLAKNEKIAELLAKMPPRNSPLMKKPQDGTCNSAVIEARFEAGQGVTILTLRSTASLGGMVRSDDGEDGEEADGSSVYVHRFSMPVISRQHCDVDPHVLRLTTYQEALRRCASSSHVTVPFAEADDLSGASAPREILWEGRAFDDVVDDPIEYPLSKYKGLHVVWYRQLKVTSANLGKIWVIDEEQTDNNVSPWDTIASSMHKKWRTANPKLAILANPRVRRGFIKPNALEEAPESMEVEAGASEKSVIMSVLKRLLSNEAHGFFYHPVPETDTDYHSVVEKPTCLLHIVQRAEADAYDSYLDFQNEVDLMVSNALEVCDDSSSAFILSAIMQKDISDAKDELVAAGHGHLLSLAD